jgi:hypothetical protein
MEKRSNNAGTYDMKMENPRTPWERGQPPWATPLCRPFRLTVGVFVKTGSGIPRAFDILMILKEKMTMAQFLLCMVLENFYNSISP